MSSEAYRRFGELSGVGPNMATHLWDIGMRSNKDIAAGDPEEMYKKDCSLKGGGVISTDAYCMYTGASMRFAHQN